MGTVLLLPKGSARTVPALQIRIFKGVFAIYYSKEELERLRIEGEKKAQEMLDVVKDGREYKSNDIDIICVHCKHTKFDLGKALLNSRELTFFDLDWLDKSAVTLICKRCGYIHWFGSNVVEAK
ncbi:hypothetical protein H1D32_23000 [Anaerobacillus sp. CMMVII]|uniref:hypothetical protein n=1 Tax=Anaerobacillus sp. CMMVII TaxID=2755588 RepID=UPI0021B73B51|nr:hypothetical protein [Anaerobacillus sp. CMMVII]MCT8140312.1 hypothetical protein [Anaerobacillus sp. CMMVII]